MAELSRAVASLRIVGGDLVPAAVSALLGCEPTKGWAKGDTLTSPRLTRIAQFGLWSLHARETEPANLDAQVAEILGLLTADVAVWHRLKDAYDVDLFCGWFMKYGNEGLSVSPETMSLLAERGILLDIDLYGGDGELVPE